MVGKTAAPAKAVDLAEVQRSSTLKQVINHMSFKSLWKLYTQAIEDRIYPTILLCSIVLIEKHQGKLNRKDLLDVTLETALYASMDLGQDEWVTYLSKRLEDKCPASMKDTSTRLKKIQLSVSEYDCDYDDGIEYCRQELEECVQNKEFRLRLALLYYNKNELKTASSVLIAHLREYPTDVYALKFLLRIYVMNGNIDEAITVQEDIMIHDNNIGNIITLAELLATGGRDDESIEYLSHVLLSDATNLRMLWQLLIMLKVHVDLKPHYNELLSKVAGKLDDLTKTSGEDERFTSMICQLIQTVVAD